ncbi:hypothetical protein [Streptomyces malaysiensis]|uniref:Nitrogen regulation protein, sigma 54-dependent response regulator NtrC (NR(I)) n=1 Tax=Streptomyces malaysiensis TaxID=92644 RepID=A0A7X6AZ41_STRMQ|nr:hypothetical protein [Streptomyces malaysiensis]NIY68034.1 Nitrogen regulation protein, sigma 54-dependent response regulator NtrC (NR(I)) [Streptomyces malaysiensis]
MARIHDPDSEFDATACVQNMLHSSHTPAPEEPGTWAPPQPALRRTRRSRGRSYGPDSIPGLADYFTRSCPPLSWAGALEIGNRQALISTISELRREAGLTPDDCRAMFDLYVRRLAGRSPSKPYVWDFKWQRYGLLRALRDTGLTVTSEDYDSWHQTAEGSTAEDDAYAASWERP